MLYCAWRVSCPGIKKFHATLADLGGDLGVTPPLPIVTKIFSISSKIKCFEQNSFKFQNNIGIKLLLRKKILRSCTCMCVTLASDSQTKNLFFPRRSPLSVWVCVFSIVSHVSSVKTTDFVAKTTVFVAKTTDLWQRRRIFYVFFVFTTNPSSSPHCSPCVRHMLQCLHCILMSEAPTLSMCGHTNEGIPSTEHVQMLHWACADIIMRGNPLTDMTDNTEDATQTDSVYTLVFSVVTEYACTNLMPSTTWIHFVGFTSSTIQKS